MRRRAPFGAPDVQEEPMSTTTTTTAKPLIRYVRNSSLGKRARGDNLSRDEQIRETDRIVAGLGADVWPEPIEDEDTTGATFDRPGWRRVVELIESGQAGGVVAFDLKRMGRPKTADMLVMVDQIESAGGQLFDQSGRISVESADDELITTVKAMLGRREWRERRDYLTRSVRAAIESGHHLSAPYGYVKEQDPDARGMRLAIFEPEARIVRLAFQLRADGQSWAKIAAALNATGQMPRPYTRHGITQEPVWRPQGVRQMVMGGNAKVENRVYRGEAHNGEYRNPDAHPAIVGAELFAAARRARGVKHERKTDGYLLTGLVRCSGCGHAMVNTYTAGKRYYRCAARAGSGSGRCPAPVSVPAEALEAFVADRFVADYLGDVYEPERDDSRGRAAAEAVALAEATLAGAMRVAATVRPDASRTEHRLVNDQLAEARRELRNAEQELSAAQAAARGVELPAELDADAYRRAPVAERRLWHSIVTAAVVVRRAAAWRAPVADRTLILAADDAPANPTALIGYVAGLDF